MEAMEIMGLPQALAAPAELTASYGAGQYVCNELITKDLTDVHTCEIFLPLPRESRWSTGDRSMERMFSIREICQTFGVTRRSVHYWISKGELKAFHLGGKRITRVWEKDLRGFVKRKGR